MPHLYLRRKWRYGAERIAEYERDLAAELDDPTQQPQSQWQPPLPPPLPLPAAPPMRRKHSDGQPPAAGRPHQLEATGSAAAQGAGGQQCDVGRGARCGSARRGDGAAASEGPLQQQPLQTALQARTPLSQVRRRIC